MDQGSRKLRGLQSGIYRDDQIIFPALLGSPERYQNLGMSCFQLFPDQSAADAMVAFFLREDGGR